MSISNKLIDYLDKKETQGYVYGDSSSVGTRHEAWIKATCLSNIALCEKIDKLIELLSDKQQDKPEKFKK